MTLYHFSEEPGIEAFVPRTPVHRTDVEPLVWAIDDWHAPMYYFPRDCPRILVWPLPETTGGDMERWFGTTLPESWHSWSTHELERMSSTPIYRYEMPYEGFFPLMTPGCSYRGRRSRLFRSNRWRPCGGIAKREGGTAVVGNADPSPGAMEYDLPCIGHSTAKRAGLGFHANPGAGADSEERELACTDPRWWRQISLDDG
ncbi:MAG: hypothetical protein R3C29_06160 [Dehalococcoidia bacterium]